VADPGKSASAAVAVGSLSVTSSSTAVAPGASQQFSATVQGFANTAVSWLVDDIAGGSATVGTISASGLYTAPAQPGSHTISATSAADPADTANATINVGGVAITPVSAMVGASGAQQFSASIAGVSNPSFLWSVDQIAGGNAAVGTVSSSGLYTAPTTAGSHTVTAASSTAATAAASANIAVVTMAISPATAALIGSQTQQFAASVQGTANTAVTWSVDNIPGGNSAVGTISSTGGYTAPALPGNHTIAAQAVADPAITAYSTASIFTIAVSPNPLTLAPSAAQQFTANLQGIGDTAVTWSVDGVPGGNATTGIIASGGLYTAPSSIGLHTVTATSAADSAASASASLTVIDVAQTAVLTFHNDDARDGAYTEELQLTPANVNATQFGKLLSYPVDGQVYAQPLYMPQLSIAGGTHNVVFVVTQNNSVYAFNADATSPQTAQTFWQDLQLGPPVYKGDTGGVNPDLGILGTPVIDASSTTLYLVSEHSPNNPTPFYLYALDLTTGAPKFGSPVVISGTVPGTGVDSSGGNLALENDCYQRMGLALNPVTNAIDIPFGSCNHGWILAYDKTTLQPTAIFNTTPDAAGGTLWASDGAPAIDDSNGNIYVMSGTDYDDAYISPPPAYTQSGYNNAFLNLNPTTLAVQSYFSPDDNYALSASDLDLGSGSNILVAGNSAYPTVTIGGGKDGNVFVVNPLDMGGFNSTNNVLQTAQLCVNGDNNIFSTPVYWNGTIYYHCQNSVLQAFAWNAATLQINPTPTSSAGAVFQMHGATPSLSANGAMNGIVWDIDNSLYNNGDPSQSGVCVLHAYNAANLASELYNSSQAGSRDTAGLALKFTVPTIANGKVFVPTATELDVYGLLSQ
jgi:hypothetical protein